MGFPRATLVVRRDLHPALQLLLIATAEEIHGRPGILHAAGAFPAAAAIDLPISDAARQFYLNGPYFLQRNMPFWIGQILQRLLTMRLPNAYAAMGYMLKLHVKNLRETRVGAPAPPPS